ncbi:UDP-N-acetylmuramate:L-alanyl-gamma-D-glutamyl-meso-diaminopimelate ligase [Advenella mimigardefordensis]|uniref:UDP-N-acetylmuramate--L-alanyl-gamma-D-glutamyl-meso-2,6-diaminoheptandioate ligase n=1 Tax=Advenella mimigardefordensis (strain DSM 17166 / LMG 22922 / DPN7) TaxID=1247726 RepID=W0PHT1_ADVMD|nr:UDP-N-acetylmuramate:L-alanyl-gamma-D-glutamyl-meso-diaminopimelate ligase [Advenella mimigardefordensis]AHG65010.1 UDP-N-acetylmuramate:L-alanyl-gamma-D-glutamyl-meso-diaminopimelate ligase [Advenella mimigardefordensis DPN7]
MHLHILGICGTFMGGLALIARAAGHKVTGCDTGVYPPMSTQLQEQGIDLIEGFDAAQTALKPDLFVIGNVVTRGNPLMEAILDQGLPYVSGPQWLGDHVLQRQHVLAVAGTHGKTTTSSMLTWILQDAGLNPNFLIGGIATNLGISAKYDPAQHYFVIEADEYDTAFFDKRSKFVHYHARTAILNNLEYDHADIFPDLAAIETQFHHLVRTVPQSGCIIYPPQDQALERVLQRGCWSQQDQFGPGGRWTFKAGQADMSSFTVLCDGEPQGEVNWALTGAHNASNALAAIAAASHVNVPVTAAIAALSRFSGIRRRMELRGTVNGIQVFDDFAHHPTAIETTLDGLRKQVGARRILAVLEPRSNTMKLGTMAARLPQALALADRIYCFGAKSGKHALGWDPAEIFAGSAVPAQGYSDLDVLIQDVSRQAQPDDVILVMSNGGFGGIHEKLLLALQQAATQTVS